MKPRLLALALLLVCPLAQAQTLKLPAEKKTPINIPVIVGPVENTGGTIKWLLPDAGVEEILLTELFPPSIADQATGRIFFARQPGRYRIWAVCGKGDKVSEKAECVLIVGDVPPGPGPGPVPPGPTPPGPTPPGPAPIAGDGLRVLMVVDTANQASLTKGQLDILYSTDVREYLKANCPKGPDGRTPEFRIWDAMVPTGAESKTWQDAMARKRDKLPWLVVSNGKTGFEGPLPANKADALAIFKQFGGN